MQNYEIRIKGRIDEHWSTWFANLTVQYTEKDETILSGTIADQATLYGVLNRLRDLGLPLLSVMQVEADDKESP
jgi:hypothetical protein